MTRLILATHGNLAESFKNTAKMIVGEEAAEEIETLCMLPGMDPEQFEQAAKTLLAKDPDADFLILADLFAASPANTCLLAFRTTNYRMVTGVNLGMLLEVCMNKDLLSLDQLSEMCCEVGGDGIKQVVLPAV